MKELAQITRTNLLILHRSKYYLNLIEFTIASKSDRYAE